MGSLAPNEIIIMMRVSSFRLSAGISLLRRGKGKWIHQRAVGINTDSKDGFRLENDSLGCMKVDKNNQWGAQTQRAVENFQISSWTMPSSFLKHLSLIKAICAKVNGEMGTIDIWKAQCINKIAMKLYQEERAWENFPVDVFQTGSGTSTNMNMNEVISLMAMEQYQVSLHPNDDVNRCQSSNDVVPSAISLTVAVDGYHHLLPSVEELIRVLHHRAGGLKQVVKSGRTHLMDATPLTMEQEMHTWIAQLQDASDIVENALFQCLQLPIGGTAVGTGVNTVKGFDQKVLAELCQITNMPFQIAPNKASRMSNQDHIVALSGALKTLASSLYKICNDLRWMHSGPTSGLREIILPTVQPGSSIMPGKVNPVICESAMMVAVQVMGSDQVITMAGQSANFQLHTMMPLIAYHILHSIRLLGNTCTNVAYKAVDGFTVNHTHIEEVLSMNSILITSLTPLIGYDKCSQIVHKAMSENRSVFSVATELTDLDPGLLRDLLNPSTMTHPANKESSHQREQ